MSMKINDAMNFAEYFIVYNYGLKSKRNRIEFCNVIIAIFTTYHCVRNIMIILYRRDLGGKQLCIEGRIRNDVENFFNVAVVSDFS